MVEKTLETPNGDFDQTRQSRPRTYGKKLNTLQKTSNSKEFSESSSSSSNVPTHEFTQKESSRDIMSFLSSTQALVNYSKEVSLDSEPDESDELDNTTKKNLEAHSSDTENTKTNLNDEELLNKIRSLKQTNTHAKVSNLIAKSSITSDEQSSIQTHDTNSDLNKLPVGVIDTIEKMHTDTDQNVNQKDTSSDDINNHLFNEDNEQPATSDIETEQNLVTNRKSDFVDTENNVSVSIESASKNISNIEEIIYTASDDENFLKRRVKKVWFIYNKLLTSF